MDKRDTKADEIRAANEKIYRPENAEAPRAGRAGRLLRPDVPVEVAGATLTGEEPAKSETEEALRRATEKNEKKSPE